MTLGLLAVVYSKQYCTYDKVQSVSTQVLILCSILSLVIARPAESCMYLPIYRTVRTDEGLRRSTMLYF